jgi:hypothetical protein
MSELEMVIKNLDAVAKCRRCSCLSCGREGAGELHDHVCTQGEHCIDTREKLLRRLYAFATVVGQARTMIKQLARERDALRPKQNDAVLEEGEVSETMAEEAGRALASGLRMAWDGLAPGKVDPQYPTWWGGAHANAHQGDYVELGRKIVEAALRARVPSA